MMDRTPIPRGNLRALAQATEAFHQVIMVNPAPNGIAWYDAAQDLARKLRAVTDQEVPAWAVRTFYRCGEDELGLCLKRRPVTSGEVLAEFFISWDSLDGEPAPRLEAYDDSWRFLYQCQDLLEEMAQLDEKSSSRDQICALLARLGFEEQEAV